ncbi:MAG: hypothetical protein IBX50_17545 [Marinospirillum sp.]|uniref:hypothetical protein n=1 Tax=Marinospirillum sp. TaxID=2183934 RepID=UPI0019F6AF00|nr:hypothetical protein [Marinospirillum sp.]MBE0508495.1 hypothetical protein [Marinospirillum sp.]
MKSKDKEKRLEKLTKESSLPEKLTYTDLLLLLEQDEQVQSLIRQLALTADQPPVPESSAQDEQTEMQGSDPILAEAEPVPEPVTEPQPPTEAELFYAALTPQLEFLQAVQADQEIAAIWLKEDETQAQSLVRLLARASQWDQLIELWDVFASRCKKQERALTASEKQLLLHSLACYNLTLNSRQAELIWPECPAVFDHQQHTRGTPQGEKVIAVWLPGLTNAAGKLQKKPLVATQ